MKGSITLAVFLGVLAVFATARPSDEVEKRLIQTSEEGPAVWLTEDEVFALIEKQINFIDITGRVYPVLNPDEPQTKAIPTTLRFGSTVRSALSRLNQARVENFMIEFSSFYNRFYTSSWGVNASNWLLTQVQNSIRDSGYTGQASASQFTHTQWAQPSVVARIWGSDPQLQAEVVIMGAHLDSIVTGGNGSANNYAPGGDDNASGSATVLETLRVILASNFIPKRTIEFHWYAAEEPGLRGSGDIAASYMQLGVNVITMVNFDVVGYYTAGRQEIALLTDYTSAALNTFLKLVIEAYCSYPWVNYVCGYGCSDHASWNRQGIPAASPIEPRLSPVMHSRNDLVSTVSFPQVMEFVKLAVSYAIEVAEP